MREEEKKMKQQKKKKLVKRGWEFTRMALYSVRVHKNDQTTNRIHPNLTSNLTPKMRRKGKWNDAFLWSLRLLIFFF